MPPRKKAAKRGPNGSTAASTATITSLSQDQLLHILKLAGCGVHADWNAHFLQFFVTSYACLDMHVAYDHGLGMVLAAATRIPSFLRTGAMMSIVRMQEPCSISMRLQDVARRPGRPLGGVAGRRAVGWPRCAPDAPWRMHANPHLADGPATMH